MISQPPITQPPQYNHVVQAEQAQASSLNSTIRRAQLRHLLQAAIDQNAAAGVATTGVSVFDMQSGQTIFGANQDTKHFAASINKLPIALLLLEDLRAGAITLDQVVTWQASDVRGGFGAYDQPGAPLQASVEDVIYDMLNKSGNTVVRAAVNYVLDGPAAVNARFAAKPELSNTSLTVLSPTSFFLGDSTPRDSLWALRKITSERDQFSRFMKKAMATNIFTDFGVRSQLPDKDYIVLVNKIGLLDDPDGNNRHDVGIIYNKKTGKSYGYSFFTTSPFASTTATPQAEQSLKDMGSAVLRYAGRNSKDRNRKWNGHNNSHVERRFRY